MSKGKDFYDVMYEIWDAEINARIKYYEELGGKGADETRYIPDWYIPRLEDDNCYGMHDWLINFAYCNTTHELKLHRQRLAELEDEWKQYIQGMKDDEKQYRNVRVVGTGKTQKVIYDWSPQKDDDFHKDQRETKASGSLSYFKRRYEVKDNIWIENNTPKPPPPTVSIDEDPKEFFRQKVAAPSWVRGSWEDVYATYIDDSGVERNYTHPDRLLKSRGVFEGKRFGYSERESIFNEPTVKFNKRGEPMATSKAKDVLKTILTKNNATAVKAPKKVAKTTDARLKNIEGLRKSWITQIVKMKEDFHGTGKATGIKYVPNDKKVEDSYFTAEFISKRKHLMLQAGKPVFKLNGNKDSVIEFLQDIVDAISIHAFDAQLLTHQRNVKKAKEAAEEKKAAEEAKKQSSSSFDR